MQLLLSCFFIGIGDIYQLLTCYAKTVNENSSKPKFIEAMLSGSPMARAVYIVDYVDKLKGIFTPGHII